MIIRSTILGLLCGEKDKMWQINDPKLGILYPYYTHSFLNVLKDWDTKDWKVFEYGGGNSSIWWRQKAKTCISVDTSVKWAKEMNLILEQEKNKFICMPQKICEETGEKFDCIIIDGEPNEWRDDCTEIAINCIKNDGILIIDNWLQNTIPFLGENDWVKSRKLLQNFKSCIYKQENHQDWKTGYWIINKK